MSKAPTVSDAEIAFLKQYPNADLSKFKFISDDQTFRADHGLPEKITVWFIKNSNQLVDIDSWQFKHDKGMQKYLHFNNVKKPTVMEKQQQSATGDFPPIWLSNGTIQKIPHGAGHFFTRFGERQGFYDSWPNKDILNFPINNFKVYVNGSNYFLSKLPPLEISYPNKPLRWENNSYFRTILATYCSTYCCGISMQHLTFSDNVFPIISSIMRFHLYFTVRRLCRRMMIGEKMSAISSEFSADALYNQTDKTPWKFNYVPTVSDKGVKGLKNVKVVYGDYSTNYKKYVPEKSDGLTKIGLQYLNESIEAYIYAVLGAQAKTRTSIINSGAGSLETQQEFRKLVEDAIVNYDVSTWILNMNTSIKNTYVKQDLAITPETWLVPSKMVILKNPIMGYNNLLKIANNMVHFGINSEVNSQSVNLHSLTGEPVKKKATDVYNSTLSHQSSGSLEKKEPVMKKPDTTILQKNTSSTVGEKETIFTVFTLLAFFTFRYIM